MNRLEQFLEECLAHLYRQHEIIQFIVFVDIGEEAADDHPEAIACDGPCRMLTRRTRPEVFASQEYAARIRRIVEYEVLVYRAVSIVSPVSEEIVAEEALFARGSLEEVMISNFCFIIAFLDQ